MEKYGTVPKRFTKAWWEYFWEYYKLHVIVTVFILSMIGISAHQLLTNPKYDVTVTYIGSSKYKNDSHKKIEEDLLKVIDDVDGNGRKAVFFQSIDELEPSVEAEAPQFRMGFMMKKNFEYQTGETYLFLMDEKEMKSHYENDADAYGFIPADKWLSDKLCERAEGRASEIFVKVPDNGFFARFNFVTDDMYMAIYEVREDRKYAEEKQREAVELANYILNYN